MEKRVDVAAMALQMGATVADLAEAELCYAPQFGAAKDPINLAGMIAANVVAGDVHLSRWEDVEALAAAPDDEALRARAGVILDVREPSEFEHAEPLPGSVRIPMCGASPRGGGGVALSPVPGCRGA